jgi:LacI family transcriptional regulator, galactose operon repressor
MSIRALASSLGLSITTVSRALAGYPDVAVATRERVEREAERSGYRPNHVARRLRTGRSGTIGIVVPSEQGAFDQFFLAMLGAVGPLLSHAGLDLVLMGAPPGKAEMHAYRHLVEHHRVDGILLARTRRDDPRIRYLLQRRVPFVAHGRSETAGSFAFLDIDGETAFAAATKRLIDYGHSQIGLINAPEQYMFAHHRAVGWQRALAAVGLPHGPVLRAEATEENGHRLMSALLQSKRPPTAVLCATDRMAVGALHAIASAGLRAGRDVSVIGYDDLPMASYTDPPLTTFEQPIARMAQRMVEMLLVLLDGADASHLQEVWVARLIARRSDGPAPKKTKRAAGRRADGGRHAQEARHPEWCDSPRPHDRGSTCR